MTSSVYSGMPQVHGQNCWGAQRYGCQPRPSALLRTSLSPCLTPEPMSTRRHLPKAPITEGPFDIRVKAGPTTRGDIFRSAHRHLRDPYPSVIEQRGYESVLEGPAGGRRSARVTSRVAASPRRVHGASPLLLADSASVAGSGAKPPCPRRPLGSALAGHCDSLRD